MKKKSLSILGLLCALTISGCTNTDSSSSVSDSSSSTHSESLPGSSTNTSSSVSSTVSSTSSSSSILSSSSSSSSSSSTKEEVFYNVNLPTSVAGAYVTSSVSRAVSGEAVVVTVALTDDDYELVSVKVGTEALNGVADANNSRVTHYTFQMGESDAEISVETREIPPVTKDHKVSFEANDFAYALNLVDEANVGDTVNFRVAVQSGYELTGVSVYTVADEPVQVEVSGSPVDGYSFTMPDADVTVSATALGAYFKVSVSDDELLVDNDGVSRKYSDYVYGYLDEDGEMITTNSTFVRAGSELLLVADRGTTVDVTGYFANGVAMVEDTSEDQEYYVFKTTMPAKNVDITLTGELRGVSVEVNPAEHIDAALYRYDEEGNEVALSSEDKLYPGETVKVVSTSIDPDNYGVGKYSVKYNGYESSNKKAVKETTMSNVSASEGIATFTVPYGRYSDNTLTIEVSETDLNLYKDAAFLGDWYGYNYYSFYSYMPTSSQSVSFKADGSVKYGSSDFEVTSVTENRVDFSSGSHSKRFMTYDGNIGFIPWSSSYDTWTSNNFSDVYFLVKGYENSANLEYKIYSDSSAKVAVIEAYEKVNDELVFLGAGLINGQTTDEQYIVPNVEVELLNGSAINEADAAFLVKKDGVVLTSVNIGSERGTYSNSELGSLVLDGFGGATLGSDEGTYVVDGSKVTVTLNEVETIYELDFENMTYALYTEETGGESTLYGTYKDSNNNEVVLNEDGTGSWNGTAFTWDETTGEISAFGVFDSDENQITVNDDGTLTIYVSDSYYENFYTGTFTKQATSSSYYGTWSGTVSRSTNGGTASDWDLTVVLSSDGSISINGTEVGTYTVDADGTINWTSSETNDYIILTYDADSQSLTVEYYYEKGYNYYEVSGTLTSFVAE